MYCLLFDWNKIKKYRPRLFSTLSRGFARERLIILFFPTSLKYVGIYKKLFIHNYMYINMKTYYEINM